MAGVSTATGFAANVGSNVLSALWNKIVQVVQMVRDLPAAVRDMDGEVERLSNVIHGINVELNREQRPPQRIVKAWLDKAGEAIQRSRSIGNDYQQHKSCLGCCPDCLCRYRISKDIRAWKLAVDRLHSQKQSDFPPSGKYGDPTPPTQILIQHPRYPTPPTQIPIQHPEDPTPPIQTPIQHPEHPTPVTRTPIQHPDDLPPRTQTSIQHPEFSRNGLQAAQSEVERWLIDKDSNIRTIGIHGMGGVGKTLLLDTINDSLKVRDSFELIIKVTVSKNRILDLQDCVADRLNLTLPGNLERRKDMLRSFLKDKKFLLLLDDIWAVDSALWTIDELQNLGVSLNDTGFKIVLTTRDKEVCARMNVQETITVQPLLEEAGWQLFRSRAFQNRNGDVPQEIEEVARQIAKECKGLPLAIIVVAAAMAHHTDLHEWEVALDQMQNVPATFYGLHPGVDEKLFQPLKWSYDALKLHDLKICFLSFAAYPEDRQINCREVIDMWIAESLVKGGGESYLHDTGHSYIKQLRDRCLIEVVGTDEVGRIDMVKMHDVLRDLAIRIAESDHRCYFKAAQGVSHFPMEEVDGKGCARISLMYNRLDSLPTTFACSSLSVLLLRENPRIKEVSGSFLLVLPSLKVLDLTKTGITSLPPSIGDLKQLASLQLQRTEIRELPETIGDLNNLQFLNLHMCGRLRCLPERIRELKRLRALDISCCFILSHLPRGISELVSLERLQMSSSSISLDFEGDTNGERKYACLKDLQSLRRLRDLSVKMKSPVKEGVMGNWWKMRALTLEFDDDVNQDCLPQDMQALKDLESLSLWRCDLERLPSWVSEFRRLVYLNLCDCNQLKELQTDLPCLRELVIQHCYKLEELELGMGFPRLEKLSLLGLESLECVRAVAAASGRGGLGERASPLPMFKILDITRCEKLKKLSGEWDKLESLEEIRCSREWWDAIPWEDSNMKTSLESKSRKW